MSIYNEPPPGMCIVPDKEDITKVCMQLISAAEYKNGHQFLTNGLLKDHSKKEKKTFLTFVLHLR